MFGVSIVSSKIIGPFKDVDCQDKCRKLLFLDKMFLIGTGNNNEVLS